MKDEIGCFKIISSDEKEKYAAGHKITFSADEYNIEYIGEEPPIEINKIDEVSIFRVFIGEDNI